MYEKVSRGVTTLSACKQGSMISARLVSPVFLHPHRAAMQSIYRIYANQGIPAADVLFLVEGGGQGALGKNWGDGTATDPTVISSRGLSDPNPFFTDLLQKPYLSQVIIGPHVYPPSISLAQDETQVWPCMQPACPTYLLVCLVGVRLRMADICFLKIQLKAAEWLSIIAKLFLCLAGSC